MDDKEIEKLNTLAEKVKAKTASDADMDKFFISFNQLLSELKSGLKEDLSK